MQVSSTVPLLCKLLVSKSFLVLSATTLLSVTLTRAPSARCDLADAQLSNSLEKLLLS